MQFYKNQIDKELLIAKIKRNPSLYEIFKKNKDVTIHVNEDIKLRMQGELDNFFTMIISGSQGGFKSSIAQEIATANDKKFDSKKISFTYTDFRQKMEESKKGDIYILDEEIAVFGTGSGRIVSSVQNMIETLRQHGACMLLISPEPKYFSEHLFTYHLEMLDRSIMGICENNKRLHEIRTCESKKHQNIQATARCAVKKEGEYIGFYIQPIKWNTNTWKEYTNQKNEFLKQSLADDFKKMDYEKIAEKIIQDPESEYCKNKNQWMLYLEKNYPNITTAEKALIIAQISINKKKGVM